MATYSTKKLLAAQPSQIPQIAEAIQRDFMADDFEVNVDTLISGGRDISVTKGNLFKAILGMRSALKITLTPQSDGVFFCANVGIYGQQVIPTVISMLFFWPVLITQIWGLIEQSALDDRALEVANNAIKINSKSNPDPSKRMDRFCTNCGTKVENSAKFCSNCGSPLTNL